MGPDHHVFGQILGTEMAWRNCVYQSIHFSIMIHPLIYIAEFSYVFWKILGKLEVPLTAADATVKFLQAMSMGIVESDAIIPIDTDISDLAKPFFSANQCFPFLWLLKVYIR